MSVVTFLRVTKLGWTNYRRNQGLSLSATLILTLTLLIVVVFMLVNSILSVASAKIRSKIDLVITFDDEIKDDQIQSLQKTLAARTETEEVHFISKEEAVDRFHSLPGVSDRTKQLVTKENNPLPRSLEIKASNADKLDAINTFLSEDPWKKIIRKNSYLTNKGTIQKLSRFERGVTTAGLILAVVFIAISLIVVINTIRLTIFARREEIEIMRLVGANNMFIRAPFIVEGALYAIVATVLALIVAWLVIPRLGGFVNNYLEIDIDLAKLFVNQLPLLILVELFLSLTVSIFASIVSMQRYLKR